MKHVDIWTDGASKGNPGPGGYGIVLIYEDKNGKVHRKEIKKAFESTTNNRMEVMSVIVALKELKTPCEVTLTSDSQYLVKAFNENWVDNWLKNDFRRGKSDEVKNIDLWEELIPLTKIHKVNFVWVKGHADNVENERCDKLANEAIDEMQNNSKV
ncbi:MAG: ribonuclease HI [Lachnospiraceae bacterium]|nr:ribonuclease HI [Lachnospiraceae bacterium]